MENYPYLLFDADNTLFDFDTANLNAFKSCCTAMGLAFSPELLACYEKHNNAVWREFDLGQASKEHIVVERFRRFFAEIGFDGDCEKANFVHLSALGESTYMIAHAVDVCRTLSQTHKLYLVTNAVASVQKSRLAKSPIRAYITAAFISEEAGAAKPTKEYFDYVFAHIEGITKENSLVIGDSLSSDIQGANNYDLPCCWYNPKREKKPKELRVDYEIRDLTELYGIV